MPSSKGLPVLAALSFAVMGTLWQPAIAATTAVSVVDNAFDPPEITVVVGDTVEWRWEGANPHSVRGQVFDSHPDCSFLTPGQCAAQGEEPFRWSPTEPGTFNYDCRVHGGGGMTGTIVVEEAPEPEPSSPSPSPSRSPTPTPTPSPTSEPPPATESPSPEPPPSPSPTPTTASPNVPPPVTFSPSPEPSAPEPEVVSEEPSFDPFPDPVEPSEWPSHNDLADDEVAIPAGRDGGGAAGVLWRVVGGLTVIGTAVTFGRVILFGAPWDPTTS